MLEIACFTASSALRAIAAGADRIELCTSYSSGGVTPALETLVRIHNSLPRPPKVQSNSQSNLHANSRSNTPSNAQANNDVSTPVPIYIMIRPRDGNFTYTPREFDTMRNDIVRLKPFASGFVFGILDHSGRPDIARCAELLDLADPLPCTFHRAIDLVADYEAGVESIVQCGFKSVLTSGGEKTAMEGRERVKKIVEKFGARISVILAGSVRSANIEELKSETRVEWVHSAAIIDEAIEECDAQEVGRLRGFVGGMGNGAGNEDVAMELS